MRSSAIAQITADLLEKTLQQTVSWERFLSKLIQQRNA